MIFIVLSNMHNKQARGWHIKNTNKKVCFINNFDTLLLYIKQT